MKLIESYQEYLIVCDNINCDFKIKNETGDISIETKQYINTACPKCGENLLTQKDYNDAEAMLKVINWINKWFGWLGFFYKNKKRYKSTVKIHNGIKIENEDI